MTSPISDQFLECLSPDSRKKTAARTAVRVSSITAHRALLDDSDVDYEPPEVRKFLDSKLATVDDQANELNTYMEGLARLDAELTPGVQDERNRCIKILKPLLEARTVLKKRMRSMTEDVGDEIKVLKRRKPDKSLERNSIAEEAYINTMSRLFGAASKQKKSKFDQSAFKKVVVKYYNGSSQEDGCNLVACHLTGLWESTVVKAAHIVPKSLGDASLEHLYGSDEGSARTSPRNALLLHGVIEEAMDRGDIAMIPLHPRDDGLTRLRCVLIDKSTRNRMISSGGGMPPRITRFKDIENKELHFSNDNRPARRFLFLRLVMSLIRAEKNGNFGVVARLQLGRDNNDLWPSPGGYLRRSSLEILARKISGLELPKSLLETTTFEDDEPTSEQDFVNMQALIDVAEATSHVTRTCS